MQKTIVQDSYVSRYFNEEKQQNEVVENDYSIVINEKGVIENVFNNVFENEGWGHSVMKNSEIFEYFSNKHNVKS